jgi:hypothetical protein
LRKISEIIAFFLAAHVAKLVNVAVSEAVGVTSLGVRVSPWAHFFFCASDVKGLAPFAFSAKEPSESEPET